MAASERMIYTAVAADFLMNVCNVRELSKLAPKFPVHCDAFIFKSPIVGSKAVTIGKYLWWPIIKNSDF